MPGCKRPIARRPYAGDLRLDAEIDFFGSPMTFTAFSTLLMTMEVTADEEGVGFTVTGVDSITTELTISEGRPQRAS